MSHAESVASFDAWLHEDCGYQYFGDTAITGLTPFERDKLQLGFIVKHEQRDANAPAAGGGSLGDQRKRDHKQSIRKRLKQN